MSDQTMTDSNSGLRKTWARAVAKAWADEEYKRRLLADPAAIAREEGVPVPEGLTLKVVEDVPGTQTLVLPPPPAEFGDVVEAERRLAADDFFCEAKCSAHCAGGGCT